MLFFMAIVSLFTGALATVSGVGLAVTRKK